MVSMTVASMAEQSAVATVASWDIGKAALKVVRSVASMASYSGKKQVVLMVAWRVAKMEARTVSTMVFSRAAT